MKKYILRTGKEVKFGDVLKNTVDFGFGEYSTIILFNEASLPWLKELGVIREIDYEEKSIDQSKKDSKNKFKLKPTGDKQFDESLKKAKEKLDKKVAEKMEKDAKELEQSIIDWHLSKALESIAKKLKVSKDDAIKYIDDLIGLNPSAAFSLLLKMIAIQLNAKYNEPLKNLKHIYYISMLDGKTYPAYTSLVNLKSFAAFRSTDDAFFARRCLKSLYNTVFNDKQESN